jgi:hypothetical protein
MGRLVLQYESFSALTTSQGMLMPTYPSILSMGATPFVDGYWLRSSGYLLTAVHVRSGKRRQVYSITTLAPNDIRDDSSEQYFKK